ncbi:hypothetical protein LNV09_24700, partial [Paucibacter sp. B2R-40]|uniref:hypothetical protein n=1 Tax=Paucibacter sp. B2R-40 TaxID=2893554 RepID=UPI0021E3DCA8
GAMTGAGSTTFSGDLTLSAYDGARYGAVAISQRSVNLAGTTNWNGGALYTSSGGSLTNSGTFVDNGNYSYGSYFASQGSTASDFVNTGTYNKVGGGTTTFAVGFKNTGTLNVTAGVLSLGVG